MVSTCERDDLRAAELTSRVFSRLAPQKAHTSPACRFAPSPLLGRPTASCLRLTPAGPWYVASLLRLFCSVGVAPLPIQVASLPRLFCSVGAAVGGELVRFERPLAPSHVERETYTMRRSWKTMVSSHPHPAAAKQIPLE